MTPTLPVPGGDAIAGTANGHRGPDVYGPVGRSPWLDVDWREHQRWVLVDGQPVNTIELGSGPPLVFVHGLSGCWQNWLEQLPVLASEHRVIAMDLPGFGYSPMPRDSITMDGYVRLLEGLLDELQAGASAVVGNSMGGLLAAKLAIAAPERVERLALVSPGGVSTHQDPRRVHALTAMRLIELALAGSVGWVAARPGLVTGRPRLRAATLGVVARHPDRLPAPLAAELVGGAGKPGLMQALEAILGCDLRPRLPEIACKTLIVWGDNDRIIPVRDADIYAEMVPQSRKFIFPDTGHVAQLERPAAFNALLRDFLAE
jgi:pimeloyl-ACP methyl ester carboxylesterase